MRSFLFLLLISMRFKYAEAQDTCVTTLPYGHNPKAGAFAKVNGINMYYEVYGQPSAPPLLLIHGNGGEIRSMRCQIEYFRQKYRVIVADSRYHGRSDNGDKPLTYELMADDYAALLQHLKLDSVNVIGQSDGAILTLLLAMDHPGTIKKGIAMAPNLRTDSTALYGWVIRSEKQMLDSLNRLIAAGHKEPALVREQVHYKLMVDQPNIPTAALSRIQVPILLMSSDGD